MKSVASRFESFVRASGLPPFDSIGQTGNWKQLTVREATEGLMAWAMCNPQVSPPRDLSFSATV